MSEDQGLKVVFALTQRDIYKANVAIARRKRPLKRRWFSVLITWLAWTYILHLAMKLANPDPPWVLAVAAGACLAVFFDSLFPFLMLPFIHGLAYYGARELVRTKPLVLEPVTYEFSSNGGSYVGPAGSGVFEWKTYLRVQETQEQFLLYPQKRLANIIPKKSFRSDVDIQRFRQLVRDNFRGEPDLQK
jgi:hypothetical protein